jgi:hypothetical protein
MTADLSRTAMALLLIALPIPFHGADVDLQTPGHLGTGFPSLLARDNSRAQIFTIWSHPKLLNLSSVLYKLVRLPNFKML